MYSSFFERVCLVGAAFAYFEINSRCQAPYCNPPAVFDISCMADKNDKTRIRERNIYPNKFIAKYCWGTGILITMPLS